MSILTVVTFSFFIGLGNWQLQRAEEKKSLLATNASLAKKEPQWLTSDSRLPKQYERVKVKGHFLSTVFLLDNQHHNHQFGYDVLSPLFLSNGSVILVDRGWIPGDSTRRIFPKIEIPEQLVELQGSVYFPSDKQWILGPSVEKKGKKLMVIERIETKMLSHILQKKLYPFIIRLQKTESYGFFRDWPIVSMPPQRHQAYALQWFAMAIVILILFVVLNLKKKND